MVKFEICALTCFKPIILDKLNETGCRVISKHYYSDTVENHKLNRVSFRVEGSGDQYIDFYRWFAGFDTQGFMISVDEFHSDPWDYEED